MELEEPDPWCRLSFAERREALARAVADAIGDHDFITEVVVEAGTVGREYDLTVAVHTDVGVLRAPLWSHARASVYCDPSIHPSNRRQLSPAHAARETADGLRRRLAAPFTLESRGLTVSVPVEDGVERIWTAERSRFRNRTAVTREDVVASAADDIDVRDLLSHFYTGTSVRAVAQDGEAFLLREASEVEGPIISLCQACGRWSLGSVEDCPACGAPTDVVVAARPPRR